MRNRIIALTSSALCTLFLVGCNGGGGSNNPPDRGFDLLPTRIEISQTTGSQIRRGTIMNVISTFLEPLGTTQGTVEYFPATQIGIAATNFPNARVPGRWRFQFIEVFGPFPPCQDGIQTVERNVHIGEMEELFCHAYVFPVSVSPNAVDASSPPQTIQVEVEGISDTYGPPQVAILDEFGNLKASVTSSVVNLGKGQIAFTPPNLTSYSNGVYQLTVNNVTASGRWDAVAAGEISIFGNTPPPAPNLPDPCNNPAPCLF